ncbi:MAG: ABC transporter ATP-binding protein/permease [Oscillospiraceae bacterium]|jgi:ATP-binding cassette subfamily B protein|nr:ABC transporter ATP-binding protein/permease [Oscillospiraceae bacterium]
MTLPWTRGQWTLLAALSRGRYLRLTLMLLASAATVLFGFLFPQVIRVTVDSVIGADPAPPLAARFLLWLGGPAALRTRLWVLALAAAVLALAGAVANWIRRYCTQEHAEYVAKRLRDTLYGHIQALPYAWHVQIQTGDIIQRCTSDVDMVKTFLSNQMGEMVRTVFLSVAAVALMLSMDPFMTLVSVSLLPVIFLFSWRFSLRMSKQFLACDEAEGALQAVAQENLTGVRVVRAFGRERFEIDRFEEKNQTWARLMTRLGNAQGNFWGVGDGITGIQIALVTLTGVLRCLEGQLSVGTFITFYAYVNMLIWPVRNLARLLTELSKTGVSLGRLRAILAEAPETDGPDDETPEIRGAIAFDHVTFSYGDRPPVLRDISFTLRPGRTLAILGGTGSGKSSLVHLLCRLYDLPDGGGRVTIDGRDIRTIRRKWLRRHVGLVLQEPFLFSRTLRENISAARPDADLETVRGKARIAAVHDAIERFGAGYDTVVGERGVTLSGGQRQRVAIARMLMQDPPIMIFDDSLSAVDTETDDRIRRALRAHTAHAAAILISHRLSTLQQADEILVLRDGRVEELGTHDELLARRGVYRRLYDLQNQAAERR